MALWKISAKAEQLWALAVFAIILSATAAAQDQESSISSQWTCSVAPKLDLDINYYSKLESTNDVHWYKWNLPSSGKFIATLDVPLGLDYDLEVYSSCSNKLCTSDNGASEKEECAVNAKAGWVYARIYGYNGAFSKTKKYYITGSFTPPKQDLVPVSIIANPYNPSDKDNIDFSFSFMNLGPDDVTDSFTAKLYVPNKIFSCTTANSLSARSSLLCTDYSAIKLSSGTQSLKQAVDVDNKIAETDEANNEQTRDLLVSHKAEYDLQIGNIRTSPGGELNDKMTFSVTAEIVNSGSDDMTDSFKAYLSADDDSLRSKECLFSGLKAGTSAFCTLENQKWTAGKHTVWAYADKPGNSIPETDEYNNDKKEDFTVTHFPEADLIVTNIYTIPSSLNDRTEFELRFEVKNVGPENVLKAYTSRIYANGQEKASCDKSSAFAGLTDTCQLKSQKWQPGTYKLKAAADTTNAIDETSENNNELEKTIEVKQYCKIPDGSAADCDCNSNTDCPSGYYCSLKEGYDPCKPLACRNECAQIGYLCSRGDVYECGNFDSDPCLDSKLKQTCNLYSQKCNPAKGSCEDAASPVKLQLEDSPSHDITVYKQPGDTVEVTITSDTLQDVEFSQPENFTLTYGICSAKTAASPGETKCMFQISETTATGKYQFVANEKTAAVAVIDKPKTVIVTNKQKLNERFSNDKAGVKALLEQAFQYASNEENMIVYYVEREVGEHPFESYSGYGESILSPEMTDNSYSLNTAAIVAEKCGDCGSIIILGDDFVLPFYRADYAFIHNWWKWWAENKSDTRYIYSDQPYIKEKKKTMGDLASLFDKSQHKKVKLVVPDTTSPDVQSKIDKIKEAVKAFRYSDNDIKQIKSSEIGCNSYSALDEATLILIGTREDNNAIKCVPWFDIGNKPTDTFKASIEIERNVWANNEYAIIVSGRDIVSGLQNLHAIIANPDHFQGTALGQKDTIYIHDFSNPPDLPPDLKEVSSHIVGFALGTCNEGKFAGEKGACIATDMVAGVVPPTDVITDIRDVVLYCPAFIWNKITGKKSSAWDGLACGGSAAGTGITIGKYVTAVTGVGAVVGTVADGGSTALKTVLKVTKSALKGESDRLIKVLDKIQLFKFENAWGFFKASDKDGLFRNVGRFAKITSGNSFYINKMTKFFPEDALAAAIKNVDDYEDIAVGTKGVMKSFAGGLDDFAPELKRCLQGATAASVTVTEVCDAETAHKIAVAVAEKIKTVGKTYDKIAAKYGEDIAKITVKGIKNNVIDQKNADLPEKLAQYAKALGKDPLDPALAEEQIAKMFSSPSRVTKMGSETINNAVILKKGFYDPAKDVGFGAEKIINKHTPDFIDHLGISNPDEILDVVKEVAETGKKVISKEPQNIVLEKVVTRGSKTANVRLVINIDVNSGNIITAFPP